MCVCGCVPHGILKHIQGSIRHHHWFHGECKCRCAMFLVIKFQCGVVRRLKSSAPHGNCCTAQGILFEKSNVANLDLLGLFGVIAHLLDCISTNVQQIIKSN